MNPADVGSTSPAPAFMRISLLANFPAHVVPALGREKPSGHYATWLPQLSEQFEAATDFDFHWITISKQFIADQPVRWRGQTFHFLHNAQRLRMLRGYARDCRLIRERLELVQPDLVHAWGSEDCFGVAGARCGWPWLLSMQGLLQEYVRRAPMHPLRRESKLATANFMACRRAREITVESRWGERVLTRLAPHARLHRVEYGVGAQFFAKEWEPDRDRAHAVFIGHADKRKGIGDAIYAFAKPEMAGLSLDVIGGRGSKLAQELIAISPPNVRWRGLLGAEETAEALRRAWCLVLPTRADTSPNVVKEARVVGLPVVTTPHGGQSDYIEDGVNGYLVEPGDVDALASRLGCTCSPLGRGRWGWAVRATPNSAHFFLPERTAQGFLALYRERSANL